MTIYERFGRLMEEREQEHDAHLQTIALLRDVLAGVIAPTRVEMTETGWVLLADPATSDPRQSCLEGVV